MAGTMSGSPRQVPTVPLLWIDVASNPPLVLCGARVLRYIASTLELERDSQMTTQQQPVLSVEVVRCSMGQDSRTCVEVRNLLKTPFTFGKFILSQKRTESTGTASCYLLTKFSAAIIFIVRGIKRASLWLVQQCG